MTEIPSRNHEARRHRQHQPRNLAHVTSLMTVRRSPLAASRFSASSTALLALKLQ
jgi:hypothetical protein